LFSAVHPARNADVFAKKAAKTEVVEQTLKNVNEEGTTTVMLVAGIGRSRAFPGQAAATVDKVVITRV
jgi:hypothetical protein